MSTTPGSLKRKTFYVNDEILKKARKALGVSTASEAIRASLKQVVDMEEFWRFMKRSRKSIPRGSFQMP
jgi:hypothetical protein